MNDFLTQTARWFHEANQQPAQPTPDPVQVAFYMGMQCEELGEKLTPVYPLGGTELKLLGQRFKRGEFNGQVMAAMNDPEIVKELLDGDMDLIWVSIGGARAQGADVVGAYMHVMERNNDKRHDDGKFHNDPVTNKVLKPDGWTPPDMTPYVHDSLRGMPKAEVQIRPVAMTPPVRQPQP